MAGGYYLPKGRSVYRVWFPWRGKKIYINKYFDNKPLYHPDQANRVLEKIRAEVDQGSFEPELWNKDKTLLIENAWEVYQAQCPCGKDRMEARERIFKDFILPYFQGKSLREIEEHHIKDWWHTLPETYAPSYLRIIRATFRAFLHFHRITRMKMFSFPIASVPRKTPPWLTKEEQEKVIEHIPIQHQPIIKFLCRYGCRVSEVCNLKKSDIDYEKGIITFRERKNNKDNTLPLFDEGKALVKSGRLAHWEYVFCTTTGQRYARQAIYHVWIKASQKAGVKVIPLKNATRHSLACQLLEAGETAISVSRILGNTATVIERSYGSISVKRAGEILDNRATIVQPINGANSSKR